MTRRGRRYGAIYSLRSVSCTVQTVRIPASRRTTEPGASSIGRSAGSTNSTVARPRSPGRPRRPRRRASRRPSSPRRRLARRRRRRARRSPVVGAPATTWSGGTARARAATDAASALTAGQAGVDAGHESNPRPSASRVFSSTLRLPRLWSARSSDQRVALMPMAARARAGTAAGARAPSRAGCARSRGRRAGRA